MGRDIYGGVVPRRWTEAQWTDFPTWAALYAYESGEIKRVRDEARWK